MALKREKVKGKIIRDHLSMAFTSVRSGILILSWEERLCSRVFFRCAFLSRLRRPDSRAVLAFLHWRPELSNIVEEELWISLRVVVTSFVPTSLWISRVVSKMFPWESAWPRETGATLKPASGDWLRTCAVHEAASGQAWSIENFAFQAAKFQRSKLWRLTHTQTHSPVLSYGAPDWIF